jgi:hypothetical protein
MVIMMKPFTERTQTKMKLMVILETLMDIAKYGVNSKQMNYQSIGLFGHIVYQRGGVIE